MSSLKWPPEGLVFYQIPCNTVFNLFIRGNRKYCVRRKSYLTLTHFHYESVIFFKINYDRKVATISKTTNKYYFCQVLLCTLIKFHLSHSVPQHQYCSFLFFTFTRLTHLHYNNYPSCMCFTTEQKY